MRAFCCARASSMREGHGAFFLKNRFCCLNAKSFCRMFAPHVRLRNSSRVKTRPCAKSWHFQAKSSELRKASRFDSRFPRGDMPNPRCSPSLFRMYPPAKPWALLLATRVHSMRLLRLRCALWASRWHVGRASHSLRPILAARLSAPPHCAPPIASMLLPLPISR